MHGTKRDARVRVTRGGITHFHAIYKRIAFAGPEIVGVRLTAAA
jgi:hypothetical protein